MNNAEFVQITAKLENYFGKDYTPEQQKIMFDILREWSIEKYKRAVNYAIRNCKYLPKIADLKNVDMETAKVKNQEKIKFVKCDKCNGEGFIKYFKKIKDGNSTLEYEYIALCTCGNADKQKRINGYNLPTLAEIGL